MKDAPPSTVAGDSPLDPQFLDFFLKGNLSLEKAKRGEDSLPQSPHLVTHPTTSPSPNSSPSLAHQSPPLPSPSVRPYDWIPDQGWQDVIRLAQLGSTKFNAEGKMHPFSRLADDIEADGGRTWREYYELEAPEEAPLPMGYDVCLTEFEKLLVLRCLRMDRVTVGITR